MDLSRVEHVYILQEREFICRNLPIYKIGRTSRDAQDRFKSYSKSTKILVCIAVENSQVIERFLIEEFKTKFIQRLDIGTESFEGKLTEMIPIFCQIVFESYLNPILKEPVNTNIAKKPLTLELIRSHISNYSHRLIKNTKEGLKEWILNLIYQKEGACLRCIDKDKPTFERLNEKGKWVKDGVKFMNNIFLESSQDGKTLLKKVQDYWIDLRDVQLREKDPNQLKIFEERLKELDLYIKILENQKLIRSRFLKSIMLDIANERYPKEYIPFFVEKIEPANIKIQADEYPDISFPVTPTTNVPTTNITSLIQTSTTSGSLFSDPKKADLSLYPNLTNEISSREDINPEEISENLANIFREMILENK